MIKQFSTQVKLTAVVVATLLSGCASKIDINAEKNALNEFIANANIASEVSQADELNWWQQLQSPQLNRLVAAALANNYSLQTSQLKLQSTLARLGEQQTQYLPQGGLSVESKRSDATDVYDRQSGAFANMNWQLDLFGRITALVDAAQASAMGQAEQLRALQIEVVAAVVKGFISYQGNVQKQAIIAEQIVALEQSIDVLQARVDEGVANELDLNRTLAQLKQQQALLPAVQYAMLRDRSTLAVLSGQLSEQLSLEPEQALLQQTFSVAFAQPNNAIALRPDISRALYNFSQANSLSVAATKALLPQISLSAFTGVLSVSSTDLSNTQNQWQVAPQISWSLLSYPALLKQREAQQFLTEAAYNEYQYAVLNAVNESELALQQVVSQQQQKQLAAQRYSFANYALDQAQAMYEEGQIPYLELLDARQDVLIAQENTVDSTVASLLGKVNAYQAFNGRWSYALSETIK